MFLPVLGVKLRSVSEDDDWRLHGLEGVKGGGEEEGRALKGVGGTENKGTSSPNTVLPGKHDIHTDTHPHQSPTSLLERSSVHIYVGVDQ